MSYPKDLNDRQDEIGTWADQTFPHATPASILNHLAREAHELAIELDPVKRRSECADVLLLMLHLAHTEGWSLQAALRDKFEINQRRAWGSPDAFGVVEHVREASA